MKREALRDLYVEELKDLYSAENQLVKALPKLAKAAESDQLRSAFEEHLGQTREHVSRLEQIFKGLEESPKGKTCKGMQGLVEEGSETMKEDYEGEEMDAALIAAAQRVEHYEIAGYGCVRTYADLLGETEAVGLLELTLQEEKTADEKLTDIAEQMKVEENEDASGEENDEMEASNATRPRAVRKGKARAARAS